VVTSIPLEDFCIMYMHCCHWCAVNTGFFMFSYFQVLKLVILVQNLVCILLIMASLNLKMFAFLVRICSWKIPRCWRYVTYTWLPSQDNFLFEFQFQIYVKITQLALTSLTSSSHSVGIVHVRTKVMEFSIVLKSLSVFVVHFKGQHISLWSQWCHLTLLTHSLPANK
jgi:hypothetical protein